MKTIFIKMGNITDISTFVANASKIEKDVTVYKGRYVVNGKSLLGMFSIDLTSGATVEFPEDEIDFENFLNTFKAE